MTLTMTPPSHPHTESDPLHQVISIDKKSFIISDAEKSSLCKRINFPPNTSFESLMNYKELVLLPRFRMTKNLKKYYPLQVLQESDRYVWLIKKELFRNTVEVEPRKREPHKRDLLTQEDYDMLNGKITERYI